MKIGIIGMGNIGKAAAKRLMECGYEVAASNRNGGTVGSIAVATDNRKLAADCDVVILSVKPKSVSCVTEEIKDFAKGKIVISLAAGVPLAYFESILDCAVIRAMTNIALGRGKAVSLYIAGSECSQTEKRIAEMLLSCFGVCMEVRNEFLIDLHTAISGSGIAYFVFIMKCFVKSAAHAGMERNMAENIVLETAAGAAEMINEEGWDIIERVATKGGVTEAGLVEMERNGLCNIVNNVIGKTREKCRKLGEDYGHD